MHIQKISPIKNFNFKNAVSFKQNADTENEVSSRRLEYELDALSARSKEEIQLRNAVFSKKFKEMERDLSQLGLKNDLGSISIEQLLSAKRLDHKVVSKLDSYSLYRIIQLQKYERGKDLIDTLNYISDESKDFLFNHESIKRFPTHIYDEDNLDNAIKNIMLFDKMFDTNKLRRIHTAKIDTNLVLFLSGQDEENNKRKNISYLDLIKSMSDGLKDEYQQIYGSNS